MNSGVVGYTETMYVGDTLFNDSVCQKLEYTNHLYNLQSGGNFTEGPYPLYTTGTDALISAWTGSEFDTLIHFNAVPGDHWLPPGGIPEEDVIFTVTDTGHVVIDEMSLKFLAVVTSTPVNQWTDTIYERIGFLHLFVQNYYSFFIDGGFSGLRCYSDVDMEYNYVNGPCIFALGILQLEQVGSLNIYPNPSTTQATVNWPAGTPAEQFTLTDAYGRVVRQWKPNTRTAALHTFSVEGLASGMYTLQVRVKDGVRSGRILVAP